MSGRWATAVATVLLVVAGCGQDGGGSPPSPSSTSSTTMTSSTASPPGSTSSTSKTGPPLAGSSTSSTRTSTGATSASTTPTTTATSIITGRVVTVLPTTRKVVALTFDGGSGHQAVDSVLATLSREKVPATFFLTGDFTDSAPTYAARLAAYGMVGNHTDTHPHLTTLGDAAVRAEVTAGRAAIVTTTGEDPRPLFRFPFGEYDSRTLGIVNDMGYVAVGWTVDTLGWQGSAGGITASIVVSRVLAGLTPGEIVLMHLGAAQDGSTLDADALPRLISSLRARGYGFVTLGQLRG